MKKIEIDGPEFQKMLRRSSIMWKLDSMIIWARISGNIKRARHFEKKYDKLEAAGFVRIF